MTQLHAPDPQTDREYLQQIYYAVQSLRNDYAEMVKDIQDHNRRIRKLEQWRDKALGITLLVGMAAGALVSEIAGRIRLGP